MTMCPARLSVLNARIRTTVRQTVPGHMSNAEFSALSLQLYIQKTGSISRMQICRFPGHALGGVQ
eukprot:COSAG02_NODE_398_length_23118_cov_49.968939_21_plen_65_part_00